MEVIANPLAGNVGASGGQELLDAMTRAWGEDDASVIEARGELVIDQAVTIPDLLPEDAVGLATAFDELGNGEAANDLRRAAEAAQKPPERRRGRAVDDAAALGVESGNEREAAAPVGEQPAVIVTMAGLVIASTGVENAMESFMQNVQAAGMSLHEAEATVVIHKRHRPDIAIAVRDHLGGLLSQGARKVG